MKEKTQKFIKLETPKFSLFHGKIGENRLISYKMNRFFGLFRTKFAIFRSKVVKLVPYRYKRLLF